VFPRARANTFSFHGEGGRKKRGTPRLARGQRKGLNSIREGGGVSFPRRWGDLPAPSLSWCDATLEKKQKGER